MGTVSTTLPSDGQTIDAADVNTPINDILSEFNGNIDNDNIKTGANINGSKLLDTSISGSKADSTYRGGWIAGVLPAVSSVTNNGQRSADVVFASTVASYLTPGMRVRGSRTVAAPTQCTDLESGSSQYFSKTTPSGMTFTDDFTVSAWIKIESYTGALANIVSRRNATDGFAMRITASGQLETVVLQSSNNRVVTSVQSIPLDKWTHVAASNDISGGTYTLYINGISVGVTSSTSGVMTAITQAGDFQVGAAAGALYFDGKIAQAAVFSAILSASTIRSYMNQGLSGSETNLVSAYSFNNAITDLNTSNANNLTANGGALATNADSPFSLDANGVPGGTYEWGIVTKVSTTTATVQFPEGSCFPTSGGVSSVDLSSWKAPFGMPVETSRWRLSSTLKTDVATTSNATYGAFNTGVFSLYVPIGSWDVGQKAGAYYNVTVTTVIFNVSDTALTGLSSTDGANTSPLVINVRSSAAAQTNMPGYTVTPRTLSSASTFIMYTHGATTSAGILGSTSPAEIFAEFALL